MIDLICKSAGAYSPEIAVEYKIEAIIEELADFLRFIREITSNFRRNGHKTNRNNSISILFLLCQLLIFKESRTNVVNPNVSTRFSPKANDSTNDFDVSQKILQFSLKYKREFLDEFDRLDSSSNTINDTSSMSTITNYITAIENTDDSKWKKELEIALLDYPLKHFYPEVYELILYTLKVNDFQHDWYFLRIIS